MVDWNDVAARAGWTGAQAIIAYAITAAGGIPAWWAAPLALVLSVAKTYVTGRLTARKAA